MTNIVSISLSAPEPLKKRAEAYARRNDLVLSEAIRRLIQAGLDEDLRQRKAAADV